MLILAMLKVHRVMAHIVMADKGMAYIVTVYIAVAIYSYGHI